MAESRALHRELQAVLDQTIKGVTGQKALAPTGTDADAMRALTDLRALADRMGIAIRPLRTGSFNLGEADFTKSQIYVQTGLRPLERASTLAHEIAHHIDWRLRGGETHGQQGKGEKNDWHGTHYRKGEHRANAAAALYLRRYGISDMRATRSYSTRYNHFRPNPGTAATREQYATVGIAAHMLTGTAANL